MPRFFHFRQSPIAFSATEWCVAQPILIGCLKGLGATPNKPTGGSCLDTDIACQFVKKLVKVRFLGHEMWIIYIMKEFDYTKATEFYNKNVELVNEKRNFYFLKIVSDFSGFL